MSTDTERREIAERLRSVAREVDRGGFSETIKHVKLAIFEDADRYRPDGTLDRLADLIEPSGHECVPGECPLNVRHDSDFIDRDALLALADEMKKMPQCELCPAEIVDCSEHPDGCPDALLDYYARRIREACGMEEEDAD